MKTVVVGMSGGVDSSVAALLLKERGFRVIGLYMRNWEERDPDGSCQQTQDFEDASLVAEQIGIPLYTVNFTSDYWDEVFAPSIEELKLGRTPNPDILCNRQIKFKKFFQKAMELGGEYLATGHYCRTDGSGKLFRGVDPNKDQSYFLHQVRSDVLKKVLFPVGELHKPQIRTIADEHGLATAKKRDSTGICFIGKRDFKPFMQRYVEGQKGEFRTLDGSCVGLHDGCQFYTIGQRKGLGIGGPGEPWFVAGKCLESNVVYVVQGEDHPALYSEGLIASGLSWVDREPQVGEQLSCKTRYRQEDLGCTILENENGMLSLRFTEAQKAVTEGQSVVLYDGDECLGGGVIEGVEKADLHTLSG